MSSPADGAPPTSAARTTRGGKASQYNVDGAAATITMGPGDLPNVDARSVVALDTDITATVSVDRTADTNSGTYTTLVSRRRSTNEQYAAILSLATTPPLIQVYRRDSKGTQINIGATALLTGMTYRAGDRWTMRLATSGTTPTTIRVKAWPTASPEPSGWTVTRTDSTPVLQAAGTAGFSAYLSRRATVRSVLVSVYDFAVVATTLCSAPAQLTATPRDGAVELAWAAVSGADAYQVRRNGVLVSAPTTTSLTDTGLANGTTYAYSVAAVNTLGAGPATAVTAIPMPSIPSIPGSLAATAGDARVSLSWADVPEADGYRVYRDGALVASPTVPSYVSTGLVNGTTYGFAVVAVNLAGASAPTATVSARPMPALPAAPTGLAALPGDRSVRLSWTPVSGASVYDVLRNGAVVASPSAANVVDSRPRERHHVLLHGDRTEHRRILGRLVRGHRHPRRPDPGGAGRSGRRGRQRTRDTDVERRGRRDELQRLPQRHPRHRDGERHVHRQRRGQRDDVRLQRHRVERVRDLRVLDRRDGHPAAARTGDPDRSRRRRGQHHGRADVDRGERCHRLRDPS